MQLLTDHGTGNTLKISNKMDEPACAFWCEGSGELDSLWEDSSSG